MDILVLPFVLGALLCTVRRRPMFAAVLLALAVATKLWPIILVPFVVTKLSERPRITGSEVPEALTGKPVIRRLSPSIPAVFVFALATAIFLTPALGALRLGGQSGFAAYGGHWEMNGAAFAVFKGAAHTIPRALGLSLTDDQVRFVARCMAAVLLLSILVVVLRRPIEDGRDLCSRAVVIVAALFLLSPTGFPWYVIWIIPLLAVQPHRSLLLLTVLLPLYYLRFHFDARGLVGVFDHGIVWLEFAPVWLVLAVELVRAKRGPVRAMTEKAA
jgi:hypothetical protein